MSTPNEKKPNRLIKEKSPYLLQHAYNPVDWYPWGEEAFNKAKKEDRPVFLSIGYSTCHWCHVMERESFEDEEVAGILNRSYVSIKVDREERPDIDHIYMDVCNAMTGQGGWPLTVIMTPEKKPFFAGTYFPKESKYSRPGLLTILKQAASKWDTNRQTLHSVSEQVTQAIQREALPDEGELTSEVFKSAFDYFKARFDPVFGGFGEAPKFPTPHNLMFLLRYFHKNPDETSLSMVEKTLVSMYRGGIYDHIGGGFARYSTDRQWLVPHFEKMLYDNALLAYTYLEAHQVTGNPLYAEIASQVFNYVLREMSSPEGGFYSAQDADSEGIEGRFYVWSPEEVQELLGDTEGRCFCTLYNITEKGNFEGKSIPNLIWSSLETSEELLEVLKDWEKSREKLYWAREKRVHPHKDDKILTSWNGLMIATLAKGARQLKKPAFESAASQAAAFIWERMRSTGGRLLARYRDGEAALLGYLDDYAFFTWGLLELYQATFQHEYLAKAVKLTEQMVELFGDETKGGFFFYGRDAERLISRPKELYDGAMPSGNSVATVNLLKLAHLTGSGLFADLAWRQIKSFSNEVRQFPAGYTFFLTALQFALGKPKEIVVVGGPEEQNTRTILDYLQHKFLPEAVLLYSPPEKERGLKEIVPYIEQYRTVEGQPAVYICENYACRAPVTDLQQLRQMF